MGRKRSSTAVALLAAIPLLVATTAAHAEFSAASIYRSASPSVVVIFGFDTQGNGSSGTGSLVGRDGMILTNSHVIFDPRTKKPYANIRVFFKPSTITGDVGKDLRDPYPIRVVAQDEALDLAVVQAQGAPGNLPILRMGDSERVDVGSSVAAIGHPGGGGLWTLTTGTISSRRRDAARDIFQTDAAINPGNSGGPLLDENAFLIGVNTFVRRVNAQGLPLEGLNYSLRSNLVRQWLGEQGVKVAVATPVQQQTPPTPSEPALPAEPEPAVPAEPKRKPAPPSEPVPLEPPGPSQPDQPRTFQGPNGEEMYGVPQRDFSLMGASKEVYERVFQKANEAFDELDAQFE
jgi:serine protease Do